MFKQFACLCACCLFVIAFAGMPGNAVAQGLDDPSREFVEADSIQPASFQQFVNDILAAHPVLEAAQAALQAAEAQERSADRPIYNPDLGFDAEDAVDKTYALGVSQTVDWAGKKKAAYAASGARRLTAEIDYQVTRNNLAAQVLNFLSEYWSAVEFARLASSSANLMHDFAQQAKLRYDAGDITQVEYETAVLAYTEVRMRQAAVVADLAEVIRELTTLGAREEVRAWPGMPGTLPTLATQPGNVGQLVTGLLVVGAANARVVAANAEVELAKRLKKPDPTFGFRVGEEDGERLIGMSFSIPLYVRNTFDEDVRASMALRSQAEADAATIERDARARLLVAMERYMTIRAGWMVWEESGASSIERRAEALRKLWDAREISMSDFLLQARQTLATRGTAMELRASLWSAWIEYLVASEQIDGWLRGEDAISEDPVERLTMRNK